MMTGTSENPWWRNPATLLDRIEEHLGRMVAGHVWEDLSGDAWLQVDPGEIEVLGCILLRELREVLQEGGLDVPLRGAYYELPPEIWEPAPRPERDPRVDAVLAEAASSLPPGQPTPAVAPAAPIAVVPGALRETALYRWWDDGDGLLYIGITGHLGGRTDAHAAGSSWMEFAVRSTVERYPNRAEAEAAEEAAIKAEQPLFNKQHNDTPEARQRLVDYLVQRGRLDLLVPAVSRG